MSVFLVAILSAVMSIGSYTGYYVVKREYLNSQPAPTMVMAHKSDIVRVEGRIISGAMLQMLGGKDKDFQLVVDRFNELVKQDKERIYIVINSRGGQVSAGKRLIASIRAAKQQGIKVICVVDTEASSMATAIFTECSKRYALFGSKIMWHSIARLYNGRLDEYNTKKIYEGLKRANISLWANTRQYFFSAYFNHHLREATKLDASEVAREGIGYLNVITQFKIVDPKEAN